MEVAKQRERAGSGAVEQGAVQPFGLVVADLLPVVPEEGLQSVRMLCRLCCQTFREMRDVRLVGVRFANRA